MTTFVEFDLSAVGAELARRKLAVPIYQRPYSWREEHWSDFWRDLAHAFSKTPPEYFVGTLVLTKEGVPGRETIIDGQQRLATTTILYSAIRDEFRRRGDGRRADIIQRTYLVTEDLATATEEPRLLLGADDLQFFKRRIVYGDATATPSKPSHHSIIAAQDFFRREVAAVANNAGNEWADRLMRWVEFVRTQVRAIVLVARSDADAFLIFETLNDRGADLTIADLLKNFLFGLSRHNLDAVREGWMQTLGALEIGVETALFTTFLRHYWSSKRGAVRERDLYSDIKQHVTTPDEALDFVTELQRAGRLYAALLNSDHEVWASLGTEGRANVETLLRLDLEQHRPLLLAALQHFEPPELRRLLRALVAWAVRGLVVGGIGGGVYERAYCDGAQQIRAGALRTAAEVFAHLQRVIPTDEEFRATFATTRVAKSSLARYYLLALERTAIGEPEAELVPNADESAVNLEHILPRNATEADWAAQFTLDQRKDLVLRLGNMALLQRGPNARIGNRGFAAKQPIFTQSALVLTRELGGLADWTPNEISTRQARLATLAVATWPRATI